MCAGTRLGAFAVRVAAFLESLDERAGASVVDLGELVEQCLALRLEGGIDQRGGHGRFLSGQCIGKTAKGCLPPCVSRPLRANREEITNVTYTPLHPDLRSSCKSCILGVSSGSAARFRESRC